MSFPQESVVSVGLALVCSVCHVPAWPPQQPPSDRTAGGYLQFDRTVAATLGTSLLALSSGSRLDSQETASAPRAGGVWVEAGLFSSGALSLVAELGPLALPSARELPSRGQTFQLQWPPFGVEIFADTENRNRAVLWAADVPHGSCWTSASHCWSCPPSAGTSSQQGQACSPSSRAFPGQGRGRRREMW